MSAKLELARHEVEDFVNNRVWKIIVAQALERTSMLSEENNKIDPFANPTAICRNQGMIAGMEEVVDLPSVLLEQVEYEKGLKEKEEKENGE